MEEKRLGFRSQAEAACFKRAVTSCSRKKRDVLVKGSQWEKKEAAVPYTSTFRANSNRHIFSITRVSKIPRGKRRWGRAAWALVAIFAWAEDLLESKTILMDTIRCIGKLFNKSDWVMSDSDKVAKSNLEPAEKGISGAEGEFDRIVNVISEPRSQWSKRTFTPKSLHEVTFH